MKQKVIRKNKSLKSLWDMNSPQKPPLLRILAVLILVLLICLFYFVYREEKRMEEERLPSASQTAQADFSPTEFI